ncbi:hypothetical protein F383_11806 [Gossypium arboreum]|uniref:NB-ARC domain-containing protein n=1 Tax=Gossypium arboreum TaxID=29729 RepID=A0A0B0Q100_GOSAR|nr:hypothetical protein F383_11806 [Gossypium arboreum]
MAWGRWQDNTLDPNQQQVQHHTEWFRCCNLGTGVYDVGKVQDRIGGNLRFSDDSWKNKSVDQKATDIYRVLRYKKFVVLLDDLWERVDLNQVGIPKPSKRNGSKLIFTTRSLAVCGEMEARKKIKVECLKSEEAWKLFQDKVGDETLNSHPDIRELAKQVAKRCGGLPLALITMGRAMACKTTSVEWNYAIKKLKRSSLTKMKNEVTALSALFLVPVYWKEMEKIL